MVDADTLKSWLSSIHPADIMIKIVSALVVLLIGFIAAKIARLFLRKILHELSINKTLSTISKRHIDVENKAGTVAAYIIYFITIVVVLNQLGITSIILYMLVALILLLVLIVFLVGFKDFIPNLFAGFFIYRKSAFRAGDTINYKGVEGVIEEISLLETKIKTKKEELMFIPNSTLIKSEVLVKKKAKPAKHKR